MPQLEPMEIKAILNALDSYLVAIQDEPTLYAMWVDAAQSALAKMKAADDANAQ